MSYITKSLNLKLIGIIFLALVSQSSSLFAQDITNNAEMTEFIAEGILKNNQGYLQIVSNYSYKSRLKWNDKNGKERSKVTEMYFPQRTNNKGRTTAINIKIEENGKPLSEQEIQKQRERVSKQLEKNANTSTEKTTSLEDHQKNGIPLEWVVKDVSIGFITFLQACKFYASSKEIIDGREAISIDFDKCDVSKQPSENAYLAKLQGTIWFDVLDKNPVKLSAWQANSKSKSSIIIIRQQRITESIWFPEFVQVRGIGNEIVFPKLKIDWRMEFFDFKLALTEVKDVKVGN